VYYEIADAKRLIAGLAAAVRGDRGRGAGFLHGVGRARPRSSATSLDTDPPIDARARHEARLARSHVPLVPELAWTLDYIRPALEGKLSPPRFDDVPEWRAIDVQRAAPISRSRRRRGRVRPHSIHDWRHTHAVALLRWGYSEQIAADHEGHKNTTLVRERYGRFKPTKHDYAKHSA
jgi:integrase